MRQHAHFMIVLVCAFLFISVAVCLPVNAALWNKQYVIKHDQGKEILCDPYIVQGNDWIYKIFRQKGEISERDFPTFLEIFKRLNPDIHDIDRIFPGNTILIPLKTVTKDTLPTTTSETITIPFASISDRPVETVVIRKGDSVSKLLSQRFGNIRSKKYQDGLRRFKILNPHLTDLNRLSVGQKVILPSSLPPRLDIAQAPPKESSSERTTQPAKVFPQITMENSVEAQQETTPPAITATSLNQVAAILNAEFYDQGRYHFPNTDGEDRYLDLSLFPVMRLPDQTRVLFIRPFAQLSSDLDVIRSYWKRLRIVRIPAPPVSAYQLMDKIFAALNQNHPPRGKTTFTDGDIAVEVKTKWSLKLAQAPGKPDQYICLTPVQKTAKPFPESIFNYLSKHKITYWEIQPDGQLTGTSTEALQHQYPSTAPTIIAIDPRHFVREVSSVLGWSFQDQVEISFPYAGVQVNAVSSMISLGPDRSCLVDFGNFAGDSISAIVSSGLKVISTTDHYEPLELLHHLLDAFSIGYTDHPTIAVRKQNDGRGVSFTFPGILVDLMDGKALFTPAIIPDGLQQFLENRGIQTIKITM